MAIIASFAIVFTAGSIHAQQEPMPQTPQTETPKQPAPTKRPKSTKNAKTTTPAKTTGDQTAPAATTEVAAQPITPTEQTDLSGTYAGTFQCDEIGLTGDTTLTITGNQFTTTDGKSGRIVASTTKGYTAVALQMGDAAAAAPTIVSLRGRKSGSKLTLTSVDSAHPCSFNTGSAVAKRRTRKTAPVAVGTEVSSPAEAGPSPADVTAPATGRKSRKAPKTKAPATSTLPATNPTPVPAVPTESPAMPPTQNPSPSPSPSPSGSPSPGPSPEGSPAPSPSPSPSPRPGN